MVVAVIVDNGEPTLAESVESLRNQTVKCNIILTPGPKTNLELARSLAVDTVMPPTIGIGRSRVNGILKAEGEYILSCDSDTCYNQNYAETAVQDLKLLNVVKAGTILPRGEYPEGDAPFAWFEAMLNSLCPYEYALAFRKSAFLNAGIHLFDYETNPRSDIGLGIHRRMFPLLSDLRMICYTRLPTKGALILRDNYLPSILGVAVPFGAVGLVGLYNEITKILKK